MKRILTFVLSIALICSVFVFFGCDNGADYTDYLVFTEIKDGDEIVGYSVKGKEGSTEKHIRIPAKYKGKPVEMEHYAFVDADMESVVIEEGIQEFKGPATFLRCEKLKKVTLPESLTEIIKGAFAECSALEDITLPKNLKIIQDQAFLGCNSLKSITLPMKIEIQETAFSYCQNLKEIYWYDTPGTECNVDWAQNRCLQRDDVDISHISGGHHNWGYKIHNGHVKWYFYSETKPTDESEEYWYYGNNGQKELWTV